MDNKKLVEANRELSRVWDASSKSYKVQGARENSWKHVADVVSYLEPI